MNEVYELLKAAGTYYLATAEGDQPRVRPFGTVDVYNGRLYIQTARSKPVSAQIKQNPKVELSAFHGGKVIRVAGTAIDDTDIEAERHMMAAYPFLQGRYTAGDGNNQVLWLKDATATIEAFPTGEKEEYKF
ncbi:MAG: pyridoxamine 5'-phosphate oxidase family protein [Oscillospiraceae bacterium]|jgi:uncharacterized pyridoxamine 5'-phosphate oxidase family protein|nr:pyridoxamine 5'-phosphate oxidase family protein [Oscillospiraceae bacterium]